MALRLSKHERVSLRNLSDFSETRLHDEICKDSSILGLGELEVLDRERMQYSGGRLDLLLSDSESDVRYEVEIMLGATDPSHIIRCIEYWDVERRRYPAYDHVAVLIAEEVTSRFLNVMSLLSGSIPLVAIQLNALKVEDQLILNFVKVLDQRALRQDDLVDSCAETADRNTWVERVGGEMLKVCDRVVDMANESASTQLALKYLKKHMAICPNGNFFNVATLSPKKSYVRLTLNVRDSDAWIDKLESGGIEARLRKPGRIAVHLKPGEFNGREAILRELVHQSVREFEE